MLCKIQNVAISSLLQSSSRNFPCNHFLLMHCMYSLTSFLSLFFFFSNECSCLFCCLQFYCLKLEQMVICLLNTKLCHAQIIITAELAPCKSGFILWNRLKDSEEIHCAAGCLWWAEWTTLHFWPKIQCVGTTSVLSYSRRFTPGFCILWGNVELQHGLGAEQGSVLENCLWDMG